MRKHVLKKRINILYIPQTDNIGLYFGKWLNYEQGLEYIRGGSEEMKILWHTDSTKPFYPNFSYPFCKNRKKQFLIVAFFAGNLLC